MINIFKFFYPLFHSLAKKKKKTPSDLLSQITIYQKGNDELLTYTIFKNKFKEVFVINEFSGSSTAEFSAPLNISRLRSTERFDNNWLNIICFKTPIFMNTDIFFFLPIG